MYTTDVSSACVDTRVRVIKTKVRVIWSGGAYRGVHLIALLRSIQFTRQSKGEAERSAAAHSTKEPSNLFEDLTGIENALSSFMYNNDEGNPPTTRGVVFAIRVIGANNQIVGEKKNLLRRRLFLPQERELLDGWVKPLSTLAPTALPTATTPTSLLFCLSLRLPTRAHSQASIA